MIVLDLRALSSVTDFFVLCTANSPPHLAALRDHLEDVLASWGEPVGHVEGAWAAPPDPSADPQWVLLDCGDVVVHLLDQHGRAFYRLEDLWADAPRVPLPAEPPAA